MKKSYILKNEIQFSLYPNPTQGNVKVIIQNLKDTKQLTIKVTDVLGREIKKLKYEEEIDISDLEKGIYFISLKQGSETLATKKIIRE